jgi:hypothetical protein
MGDSPVLPTDQASTTDTIGFRDAQQQKEIKAPYGRAAKDQ